MSSKVVVTLSSLPVLCSLEETVDSEKFVVRTLFTLMFHPMLVLNRQALVFLGKGCVQVASGGVQVASGGCAANTALYLFYLVLRPFILLGALVNQTLPGSDYLFVVTGDSI